MKGTKTWTRLSALILALALLVMAAGCEKKNPSVLKLPESTAAADGKAQASPEPLTPLGDRTCRVGQETIPESTLFSFVLNEASFDPQQGLTLKLSSTNKSNTRNFVVSLSYLSVNGYMQDANYEATVPSGQNVTGQILIPAEDLRTAGVSTVDELILYPLIYDPAVTMGQGDVVDGAFSFYPTGQSKGNVVYPVRQKTTAEQTFFDNTFGAMVILGAQTDSGGDLSVKCYLENRTERFLSFTWSDVTVNSAALGGTGETIVAPGMRRYVNVLLPGVGDDASDVGFKVTATPLSSTGSPVSPLMEQRGVYRFGTASGTATGTTSGDDPAGTTATTAAGTATPPPSSEVYTTPTAAQKKNAKSGYIKKDDVNMRSGPGTSYKTVGSKLKQNTAVTLYELQNGWWFLKADGKYGYVKSDFVSQGNPPKTKATATPKADSKTFDGTVTARTKAALRKSADTNAQCLKELKNGAKLTIYYKTKGKDGNTWYYAASGKTKGYISADLVKTSGKVPSK